MTENSKQLKFKDIEQNYTYRKYLMFHFNNTAMFLLKLKIMHV